MVEGGFGDVDDVGDCFGFRYNDWFDDDDDNSENKGIVWYLFWVRIGIEVGIRVRVRVRVRVIRVCRVV